MDTKKLVQEKIIELYNSFDNLILTNELDINSIEDIAMKNIEEYKQIINSHIEDLIFEKTDEKNCLLKKRDWHELGYELENKGKVNYTIYEHNGWFIGSSARENSNKTVVQLQIKQAGVRWSVDSANYIIALRCMVESDNWDKVEKIVVDYFNR